MAQTDLTVAQRFFDAKAAIKNPKKDMHNTWTDSDYASMNAIKDEIDKVCELAGFTYNEGTGWDADCGWYMVASVFDRDGNEYRLDRWMWPIDIHKKAQEDGSYQTYGRRYLARLVWGIVDGSDDDDGNTAQQEAETREQRERAQFNAAWADLTDACARFDESLGKKPGMTIKEYKKQADKECANYTIEQKIAWTIERTEAVWSEIPEQEID